MTRESAELFMFGFKNYQWQLHPLLYKHVELGIKMVFDDFASRTCENCKYSDMASATDCFMCDFSVDDGTTMSYTQLVHKDFGCNKWEIKEESK